MNNHERNKDREDKEVTKMVQVNNLYRERQGDTVDKVLLFIFAFGIISWIYAVCG